MPPVDSITNPTDKICTARQSEATSFASTSPTANDEVQVSSSKCDISVEGGEILPLPYMMRLQEGVLRWSARGESRCHIHLQCVQHDR